MRELNFLPQDSNPLANTFLIRIAISILVGNVLIFLLLHEILSYWETHLENQVATLQVEVDRITRMQKLADLSHAGSKNTALLAQAIQYQAETALFWQSIDNEKRDNVCLLR